MADSEPKADEGVLVGTTETAQVTQTTTATTVTQKWWVRLAGSLDPPVIIGLAVLVLLAFALYAAFADGSSLLAQLQEQAFARGLITFIFTLGTLGIALTLVGSALFGNASQENFRRAREVFSVLAGVLGTIVGFYFGSTGHEGVPPTVAPVRIVALADALQLTAFVSGGTPPYEYDLDVDGKSLKGDVASKDGWIVENLGPLTDKLTGELRVKDVKGQAVDTGFTYPTAPPVTTPSPPPTRPQTPPSTTQSVTP
jgi:hypothetical protein